MINRNDCTSNHITYLFKTIESLAISWFFSSCQYFPATLFLKLKRKREKVGCMLTSLLHLPRRELLEQALIHYQAVFLPAVFRAARPTAGRKLEEDTAGHQRMGYKKMASAGPRHNCKVWAQPLPASLAERY